MKINDKVLKWIKYGVFVLYISILVYFLFFAENLGRTVNVTKYRYNLIPFKEIRRFIIYYRQLGAFAVLTNLLGNVIAFMPFGAFLPLLSDHKLKFLSVAVYTFDLTLIIEFTQLFFKVGSFDVDDIILNTLGGILGYLMLFAWRSVIERKKQKV